MYTSCVIESCHLWVSMFYLRNYRTYFENRVISCLCINPEICGADLTSQTVTGYRLYEDTKIGSRNISIDIETRLRAGRSGLDSQEEQVFYLNSITFRSTLVLTQPEVQWVRKGGGDISSGKKRQWRNADYALPSTAKVKNGGVIPPLPQTIS
jgi:hypothetical protein